MAVAVNSQNGLYIRLNRALSLPVKYWPVIQTIVQKETVKGLVQVSFHYHLCRRQAGSLLQCSHQFYVESTEMFAGLEFFKFFKVM